MASPQRENGYTATANEIMEVLARSTFTSRERRVLDVVLRYTYGYSRKQLAATMSAIADATALHRQDVGNIVRDLVARDVLSIERVPRQHRFLVGVQKDYDRWQVEIAKARKPGILALSLDENRSADTSGSISSRSAGTSVLEKGENEREVLTLPDFSDPEAPALHSLDNLSIRRKQYKTSRAGDSLARTQAAAEGDKSPPKSGAKATYWGVAQTVPDAWRERAKAARPELDIDDVAEKFRAHYATDPKPRRHWEAVWEQWVGRERVARPARSNGNGISLRSDSDIDRAARELGLSAKVGESYPQLSARIQDHLRRQAAKP